MANIQHNCAACGCQVKNVRKVRQERVDKGSLAPGVEHQNVQNVVLNTAKMCDSQVIQQFHADADSIDEAMAVHRGAAREIAVLWEKAKKAHKRAAPTASGMQQQTEIDNGRTIQRTRGRGTSRRVGRGRTVPSSNLAGPSFIANQYMQT